MRRKQRGQKGKQRRENKGVRKEKGTQLDSCTLAIQYESSCVPIVFGTRFDVGGQGLAWRLLRGNLEWEERHSSKDRGEEMWM